MIEQVTVFECSFCGRKLSQDEMKFIGCCPVCKRCYRHLMKKKR